MTINKFDTTKFMEDYAKKFYMNENSDRDAFAGLDKVERSAALFEFGYAGYVKTQSVIKQLILATKDDTDKSIKEVASLKLYKDVQASAGDITKLKEYKIITGLLDYVIMSNSNRHIEPTNAATDIASRILRNLQRRAAEANKFKSLISKERTSLKGDNLATTYYNLSTMYLIMIADAFYSNAMHAEIDYTTSVPTLKYIYFSVNQEDFSAELQLLSFIEDAKILSSLTSNTLVEQFEQAESRMLSEGAFDVIFSIVSQSKLLDATLLLVFYVIRSLAYAFFYMRQSYKNINLAIEDSIKLRSKAVTTEEDFRAYKSKYAKDQIAVSQSLLKSGSSIRYELENDREILTSGNRNDNSIL